MKKLLSLLLIIGILLSIIPVNAATTGTCGSNLTWSFESGTLTINGSGDMYEWSSFTKVPWYSVRDDITNIVIDDNVTRLTKDAFYGTAYYNNNANWENGVLYIGRFLVDAVGVTDCKVRENTVCIGDYAFSYCTDMWNITIPDSVKRIGKYAFYNCPTIRRIKLPDELICIDDYAFYNCYVLYEITIPANVSSIGKEVFSHCHNLTNIFTSRDSLYYSSIDGILFDKDRRTIIRYPENRKKDLYYIPYTVKKIDDGAFSGCKSLARVIIPNSVKEIGENAFFNCTDMTSITLPYGIEKIGRRAFYNSGYFNISGNWEGGILYIGQYLVAANSAENHNIKDGTIYIADGAFKDCETMTSVNIPGSVTVIGNEAFSGCDKLIGVNIPKGVTSIGQGAFFECTGLMGISIPVSVKNIGTMAFYNCVRLMGVFYAGNESQWKNISVGDYNTHMTGRKIYYNYELVPADFVFMQEEKTQAEIEKELSGLGLGETLDMAAALEAEQALESEREEERGNE